MKKKNAKIIVAAVVAVAVMTPFVAPLFFPWTKLNSEDQEINIKTGQARYTRYVWYIQVSQRIEDTPLSEAMEGDVIDVADIEPWHFANTFSPGVPNSPHYLFHSALYQARQLKDYGEFFEASGVPKREIATTVLTLWQQSGKSRSADEYLWELLDQGFDKLEQSP